ncbi:uncharacterized protein SEPMUDRAFT_127394 [Sphaerulina musiva SO2202]|uniref:Uncharacterized protein n=1 Tax=Sphaerulina musiva (strain SO2202) TaxID=692275 RepID=N1QED7_SPHMS|nr:uncharacterized protein SEPMUDRAFT_127394 [Sphaerulina musiva SO2202]EMF10761.1 hypothetical protein SEPMUDRAFT_127394 [Sphaerulina musiva SO2202]
MPSNHHVSLLCPSRGILLRSHDSIDSFADCLARRSCLFKWAIRRWHCATDGYHMLGGRYWTSCSLLRATISSPHVLHPLDAMLTMALHLAGGQR